MARRARPRLRAAVLGAGLLGTAAGAAAADEEGGAGPVERGAYLVRAGGCVTCHTREGEDAVDLAGGRALETRYGTFRTPNITPDPETGIGDWGRAQFVRALRHGVSPAGEPYYPAFPYGSYAGMTDEDAGAIYAYLQSLEPVTRKVAPHDLHFPFGIRAVLWPWRWLFFDAEGFRADPDAGASRNRGAYLVRHLGHCGECHTPRNRLGARIESRHLAGNPDGPEGRRVPNITPHPEDGIGEWDRADVTFFLETGFDPGGDVAGGGMGAVIRDSTGRLTGADREAIADYLMGLEPLPSGGRGWWRPPPALW